MSSDFFSFAHRYRAYIKHAQSPPARVPLHVFRFCYLFGQDFIDLPGAGHCPQDEAPHLTDPVVLDFVNKHYKSSP